MEIDFSLLEISGEDDSLLQNQSEDVSVFNASPSPFSCSPLLHRPDSSLLSPTEKGNGMMENRSFNQGAEKENKSLNQPKLGVEGQQMKRKKKGGYNLRKSLAWNRAFFTEEGVLSSSELSLITGNIGNSTGETLSVIHEDGESEVGAVGSDSVGLQALEKNLFKELHVYSPGAVIPKHKQNVHSPFCTSRSGSKSKFGGCPKPVVSSTPKRPGTVKSTSLKRPANANMTKGTIKESKVSKLPISKVDSSVLRTSAKNVEGTSKAKRDQIAKPDRMQKTIRSPGYSIERKEAPKNAESSFVSRSLLPKFSSQHARRNTGSTTSRIHSSAGVRSLAVSKTDSSIKENSRQDNVTVDSLTNGHDVVSTKNDCVSQHRGNITGNKQQVQQQIAKPSRLRMPSPSLGFFTQLKASATNNLLQSQKTHGSQSSIPSVSKFGAPKPIGATGNLTPGESIAAQSVPSTVTDIVRENIKATYQASKLMEDRKSPVDRNKKIHETTNNQQQSGHGDVKQQKKVVKLQNKLVNQSGLSEEVKEENGANATHIDRESQDVRNTGSRIGNESGSGMCGSSKACDDFVNMVNDVNRGQAGRLSPCSISNHQTLDNCQSQYNGSSAKRTKKFRDLQLENSVEYELPCSKIGCSSGELESFYCSTHGIDEKQEKGGASDRNDKSRKFMGGNECMRSSVEALPFPGREQFCDASIFESQNLVHDATTEKFTENPADLDSCQVAPRDFQDQNETRLTDFFLHREIVSSDELVDGDKNEFALDGKADSFGCKLEAPPLAMQHKYTGLGYIDLRGKHDAGSSELKKTEEVAGSVNAIDNNNNSQLHTDLPKSEVGSLVSADYSIHAGRAKVDSEIEDEINPTVVEKNENTSFVDNHCAVSTLRLEENISCQQGHQVSIEDAFVHNPVPASPKSNQLGDEKGPHLDGKIELGDQAVYFSYDFPLLRGEQNLGTVSSSSSRTIYPLNGDTRLVVEDADEAFMSREYDSSSLREEQNRGPVGTCNSVTVCSSKGDTGLEIEADQTLLCRDLLDCKGVKTPNSNCSVKEAEVEMVQEIETASEAVENADLTQGKSGNEKTQAPPTIKPPPNAVPFSDEWLAAFEAAGEEILAKKGGAVQNSPPDKPLPEPGPWSPVKRKSNQEIGPFDCTKFTNAIGLPRGSNER